MTGDELWLDAELEKNKFKGKQRRELEVPTFFLRIAHKEEKRFSTPNVFLVYNYNLMWTGGFNFVLRL